MLGKVSVLPAVHHALPSRIDADRPALRRRDGILDGELEGWVTRRVGDQQRDQVAETKPGANNCFCNRISVPADDANGVTPPPSAESQ